MTLSSLTHNDIGVPDLVGAESPPETIYNDLLFYRPFSDQFVSIHPNKWYPEKSLKSFTYAYNFHPGPSTLRLSSRLILSATRRPTVESVPLFDDRPYHNRRLVLLKCSKEKFYVPSFLNVVLYHYHCKGNNQ